MPLGRCCAGHSLCRHNLEVNVLAGAVLSILAQLRSSELSLQIQGAAAVEKLAEGNQPGRDAIVAIGMCKCFCLTPIGKRI